MLPTSSLTTWEFVQKSLQKNYLQGSTFQIPHILKHRNSTRSEKVQMVNMTPSLTCWLYERAYNELIQRIKKSKIWHIFRERIHWSVWFSSPRWSVQKCPGFWVSLKRTITLETKYGFWPGPGPGPESIISALGKNHHRALQGRVTGLSCNGALCSREKQTLRMPCSLQASNSEKNGWSPSNWVSS